MERHLANISCQTSNFREAGLRSWLGFLGRPSAGVVEKPPASGGFTARGVRPDVAARCRRLGSGIVQPGHLKACPEEVFRHADFVPVDDVFFGGLGLDAVPELPKGVGAKNGPAHRREPGLKMGTGCFAATFEPLSGEAHAPEIAFAKPAIGQCRLQVKERSVGAVVDADDLVKSTHRRRRLKCPPAARGKVFPGPCQRMRTINSSLEQDMKLLRVLGFTGRCIPWRQPFSTVCCGLLRLTGGLRKCRDIPRPSLDAASESGSDQFARDSKPAQTPCLLRPQESA